MEYFIVAVLNCIDAGARNHQSNYYTSSYYISTMFDMSLVKSVI